MEYFAALSIRIQVRSARQLSGLARIRLPFTGLSIILHKLGQGDAGASAVTKRIDFQTEPSRYRHWRVAYDGAVATLSMDVDEDGGLFEGYQLKLNSYDLGVDIELADAVQRLRFEHPGVKVVILRSGKNRVFCAGANIRMLAGATHAHKVNFCKFTNETRNGLEDSSENSGQRFITV